MDKKQTKKDLKESLKRLQEKNQKLSCQVEYQQAVIREYKRCCEESNDFNKKKIAYEAPVQFVECKARQTSYLIFSDGHYVKVKKAKGEKHDPEIALMYLLVKNSYNLNKLKELLFNKKSLKVGEILPIKINNKKR